MAIYVDPSFRQIELWPFALSNLTHYPNDKSIVVERNIYFNYSDGIILGSNFEEGIYWQYDITYIFGFNVCVSCNSKIELVQETKEKVEFKTSFEGVKRKVIIDLINGKILSNEKI